MSFIVRPPPPSLSLFRLAKLYREALFRWRLVSPIPSANQQNTHTYTQKITTNMAVIRILLLFCRRGLAINQSLIRIDAPPSCGIVLRSAFYVFGLFYSGRLLARQLRRALLLRTSICRAFTITAMCFGSHRRILVIRHSSLLISLSFATFRRSGVGKGAESTSPCLLRTK